MGRVYLIRHGQSEGNFKQMILGSSLDLPLTELGKKQAEDVKNYLEEIHIDEIYASPLKRAVQTAEPLSKAKNIEIIQKKGFIEWDLGTWDGQTKEKILNSSEKDMFITFNQDPYRSSPPKGELPLKAVKRFEKCLKNTIMGKENKDIAIFAHAGIIRLYVIKNLGEIEKTTDTMPFPFNASVTTFDYDGNNLKMISFGKRTDGIVTNSIGLKGFGDPIS